MNDTRRRLRAWKITQDGPFWGAVLAVILWGSATVVLLVSVVQQRNT